MLEVRRQALRQRLWKIIPVKMWGEARVWLDEQVHVRVLKKVDSEEVVGITTLVEPPVPGRSGQRGTEKDGKRGSSI